MKWKEEDEESFVLFPEQIFLRIDPIFIVEQSNSFVQLREPSHLTPK